MKTSIMILGIIIGVFGLLCFWSTCEWKFGFFVVPNPFVFLSVLAPYYIPILLVGVIVGTYSSIYVASPLLIGWYRRG